MSIRTPGRITERLLKFSNAIVKNGEIKKIINAPRPYCREGYCFLDVKEVVSEEGGKQVNGWVFWQKDNMFLEAEAHTIWENSNGELIDVTPHTPTEPYIYFIIDERVQYTGKRINNIREALTDSKLVEEYILLFERKFALEEKNKIENDPIVLQGKDKNEYQKINERLEEMDTMFERKTGRNEKCTCGSGYKYKKCCLLFK